jgi:peptidoglycan/LPS O-acetylase OafA/YrhL
MQHTARSSDARKSVPAAPRKDVPGLTGLRFVAALSVALAHGSELILKFDPPLRLTYWIPQLAGLGMSLFFVLSGFVIHYNYRHAVTQGSLSDLGGFIWARFSRLYPLYFFILMVDIVLGRPLFQFVAGQSDAFTDVLHALPYYLTFTQSWLYAPVQSGSLIYAIGANSSLTWSISTEWFFYLSYPLVALLVIRAKRPLVAIASALGWCVVWIIVVSLLAHNVAHIDSWAIHRFGLIAEVAEDRNPDSFYRWLMYFSPYLRIGEFILGCFLAQLYALLRHRTPSRREQTVGRCVFALGIVSVPVFTYLMYAGSWEFIRELNYNFGLAPSAALIIFCAARYDTFLSRILNSRPVVALGEASYSIYLIHFLIFNLSASFLGDALPATATNVVFLAGKYLFLLALIIVISLGLHAYIEVPARQWLRGLWREREPQRKRIIAYSLFASPAAAAALVLLATPSVSNESVASGVRVIAATYGANCKARGGNATRALSTTCNGKDNCDYIVDVNVLGDPAPGCTKNFAVEYECAPNEERLIKELPGEAGLRSRLLLSCPATLPMDAATATHSVPPSSPNAETATARAGRGGRIEDANSAQSWNDPKMEAAATEPKPVGAIHVLSATYGANCGASAGNATADVQTRCDGDRKCTYMVDVERLGDPAPECAKDFVAAYSCAPDAPIVRKHLPPEAGFRGVLDLSCMATSGESTR